MNCERECVSHYSGSQPFHAAQFDELHRKVFVAKESELNARSIPFPSIVVVAAMHYENG